MLIGSYSQAINSLLFAVILTFTTCQVWGANSDHKSDFETSTLSENEGTEILKEQDSKLHRVAKSYWDKAKTVVLEQANNFVKELDEEFPTELAKVREWLSKLLALVLKGNHYIKFVVGIILMWIPTTITIGLGLVFALWHYGAILFALTPPDPAAPLSLGMFGVGLVCTIFIPLSVKKSHRTKIPDSLGLLVLSFVIIGLGYLIWFITLYDIDMRNIPSDLTYYPGIVLLGIVCFLYLYQMGGNLPLSLDRGAKSARTSKNKPLSYRTTNIGTCYFCEKPISNRVLAKVRNWFKLSLLDKRKEELPEVFCNSCTREFAMDGKEDIARWMRSCRTHHIEISALGRLPSHASQERIWGGGGCDYCDNLLPAGQVGYLLEKVVLNFNWFFMPKRYLWYLKVCSDCQQKLSSKGWIEVCSWKEDKRIILPGFNISWLKMNGELELPLGEFRMRLPPTTKKKRGKAESPEERIIMSLCEILDKLKSDNREVIEFMGREEFFYVLFEVAKKLVKSGYFVSRCDGCQKKYRSSSIIKERWTKPKSAGYLLLCPQRHQIGDELEYVI